LPTTAFSISLTIRREKSPILALAISPQTVSKPYAFVGKLVQQFLHRLIKRLRGYTDAKLLIVSRCVIGVDLGGTNVRAGAFYEDGSPAGKQFENPSHAQKGTEAIFDALAGTIRQAMGAAESKPEAVGLAIPGHIDNAAGIVRWAPNFGQEVDGVFESWFDVPVRAPLSKHIDIPIFMDNDANMAALGEYRYGCGKGAAKSFVMVTMGTGIGGGVILSPDAVLGDARGPLVLVGGNKGGAELGHIIVNMDGLDCNAGTYGTVEAYCQRDAIVRRAQFKIIRGRASALTELSEGNPSSITPRMIFEACEAGDEVAIETFREVGTILGVGVANYINIFAPDIVAIGGQVSKAGKWLLDPIFQSARSNAITSLFRDCEIRLAEQVEDAGMLGGAALAFEAQKWAKS
jgi:glucokinase